MKRILSLLICITVVISAFSVFSHAVHAQTSGTCGDNLTWSYADGTLDIVGTGDMYNYSWTYVDRLFITTAPWVDHYMDIETVNISPGVTSIGGKAFIGCVSLSSVDIPNTVTSIGDEAFNGCKALTSIKLPDSLTLIENVAFKKTSLTSIEIPDRVTRIGNSAFLGCSSLESVKIGKGVTSIDVSAFSGCYDLVSITVDSENKWYRSEGNCIIDKKTKTLITGCKNSTIPSDGSVTSIGTAAFSCCRFLTSVDIPGSVKSIGDYAFENCIKLKTVTMGNGTESIGEYAFSACKVLKTIEIPDSVASIAEKAFDGCRSLTYTSYDNARYLGNSSNPYVVLKEAISKDTESCVVEPNTKVICYSAFSDCSSLASIEIPDSVKSIGNGAFSGCTSLTSAAMGEGMTSIGSSAFSGCSGLATIVIPGGVTTIGNGAFSGCVSLNYNVYDNANYLGNGSDPYYALIGAKSKKTASCVIAPNTKLILSSAFSGCASLKSVGIPNGVMKIGDCAFRGCTSLTSVGIPESVTEIGADAFSGCTAMTSVSIPDSVKLIGVTAFYNCVALEAVHITDVAAWCAIVFCDNNSNPLRYSRNIYVNGKPVTDLVIPEGVEKIEKYAFGGCNTLTSAEFPDSLVEIDNASFKGCSKITSVRVPENVTRIGNETFRSCTKLKSVFFGGSTITIDNNAFRACTDLQAVTFPGSLMSVGDYAFFACDSLNTVNYHGTASEWDLVNKDVGNIVLNAAGITFEYHIYDEFVITAPTCTDAGARSHKCIWCDEAISEPIPATGHDFEIEFTVDLEPTVTETGVMSRHCKKCGAVTDVTTIPPTGRFKVICDGAELGEYCPGDEIELPVPETEIKNGAVRRFFTWLGAEVTRGEYSAENETSNGRTYTMTVPGGDVELTAVFVLVGDLTEDDMITLRDLIAMKSMFAGSGEWNERNLEAADINFDGLISLYDISNFKSMLVGGYTPAG